MLTTSWSRPAASRPAAISSSSNSASVVTSARRPRRLTSRTMSRKRGCSSGSPRPMKAMAGGGVRACGHAAPAVARGIHQPIHHGLERRPFHGSLGLVPGVAHAGDAGQIAGIGGLDVDLAQTICRGSSRRPRLFRRGSPRDRRPSAVAHGRGWARRKSSRDGNAMAPASQRPAQCEHPTTQAVSCATCTLPSTRSYVPCLQKSRQPRYPSRQAVSSMVGPQSISSRGPPSSHPMSCSLTTCRPGGRCPSTRPRPLPIRRPHSSPCTRGGSEAQP